MKLSEIKPIGNHIIHLPALERDNTNHLYYNHIAEFIRAYINGLGNKINDVDVTDVKRNKLKTIPQECPVRKATMMTNESFNFIQLLNF